jgi:hypothetical protein
MSWQSSARWNTEEKLLSTYKALCYFTPSTYSLNIDFTNITRLGYALKNYMENISSEM